VFDEILGISKDQMHNYFSWNFEEDLSSDTLNSTCKSTRIESTWSAAYHIICDIIYDTATEKAIFQWPLASWLTHSDLETDTAWIIIYLGILRVCAIQFRVKKSVLPAPNGQMEWPFPFRFAKS